jgi:hypothetical protein
MNDTIRAAGVADLDAITDLIAASYAEDGAICPVRRTSPGGRRK